MSSDPGAAAAGQQARSAAELQQQLTGVALPYLTKALASYEADLGAPGSIPANVASEFRTARETLMGDYSAEQERAKAEIIQQAKQSGMDYSPAAINETLATAHQALESGRARSLRALSFQEANAGLAETNALLSSINAGAGSVLSGSYRFGANALSVDDMLSQAIARRRAQNSQYGSIAGTIVGGLLGTLAGGQTVLGAGLGGAAGGALGGFFG